MSELIQLDNLSLDTLTELAKESFADCQDALQVYLDNEQKLKRFGDILKACRAKVPHGKWQQWVLDTFAGHLSLRAVQLWIAEAKEPEKRQKRLEQKSSREQKARDSKAQTFALLPEQPPAPLASSGVIRNENPPSQPQRPEWLADPDEMGMPDVNAMPPLPRTNTHHTTQNRRTPDARETDRAGIVCPDDPRGLQDGKLYVWSEAANRLFLATACEIRAAARELRLYEIGDQMVVEHAVTISPVVEPVKESVSNKPGKVPTAQQLTTAVGDRVHDGDWQDLWRGKLERSVEAWARYKQSLTGKAKVRSMESWEAALSRIENVAHDRGVDVVCDMIQKAIANGWQGWEHETSDRKQRGAAGGRIYAQLERAEVKYDPLPE